MRPTPFSCAWLLLAAALVLGGCSSTPQRTSPGTATKGGGYYKDDGPPDRAPVDLDRVPDAVPRIEPLASGPNKPYVIFGKRYVPDTSQGPYRVRGTASWYGRKFHGARTSNGDIYDMYAMTAAHTTLPIPSYARVTRPANGRSVLVRINDRGPFHDDRVIDLSYAAAHRLGLLGPGSGEVIVERLMPDEIARIQAGQGQAAGTPPPSGDDVAVASALPVAIVPDERARELAPLPAPAAAPAPATPPPPSGMGNVYLQLGAFGGLRNAEEQAERLRPRLADMARLSIVSAGALHRLQLGPYASRESALAAAEHVRSRVDISPVVVVR